MTEPAAQERTRVALLGAGFIAEHHVCSLRELPFVDVVAVCDPNRRVAEAFAQTWDIPRVHGDLAELIATDPPDLVHVLSPPRFHLDNARALLEAGVGVFVEKPLGLTSAGCREVTELAADRGVPLGVNHNNCFHPAYRELQRRVAAQEIGPPEFVASITNMPLRQLSMRWYGHWVFREPQNILLEVGCHPFSMIHGLLGEARRAQTQLGDTQLLADELEFHKSWRVLLDCERGSAMALLAFGRDYFTSRLTVIGPDGSLEADLGTGAVTRGEKTRWPEFYDIASNSKRNARRLRRNARRAFWSYVFSTLKLKSRSDLFYVGMRDSIHAFYHALRKGEAPPVGGDHGRAAVACCELTWEGRDEKQPPRADAAAPPAADRPADGPLVLVTGATGFIGSHLCEQLRDRGNRVRAFVRSSNFVPPWLRHEGAEIVEGDLTNPEHLTAALDGVDSVMHLATGLSDTWAETKRVSVDGTRTLAELCRDRKLTRFVYTSSIASLYVGDLGSSDTVTEELAADPKPKARSIYVRAKIACEELLLAAHQEWGLPVAIFRPGLVIGPRGLTRHSGAGYWPQDNHCLGWGDGEHPLPWVLVGDVASALTAALEHDGATGRVFNLVGEVLPTAREYVAELARRSHRALTFHPQSLLTVQALDIFKWFVKVVIRKPENPFPAFRDLKARALAPRFDCSAARDVLGWRPESNRDRFLEIGLQRPLDEGG